MSLVPIRPVVGPVSVRHRGPASWTQLCAFSHHAFRSLRHIRDEIGTRKRVATSQYEPVVVAPCGVWEQAYADLRREGVPLVHPDSQLARQRQG
jgi:hypothetical protein